MCKQKLFNIMTALLVDSFHSFIQRVAVPMMAICLMISL